jgi:hypothetical protein
MEIHIKILLVEELYKGGGGFVGILNMENEILEAVVSHCYYKEQK